MEKLSKLLFYSMVTLVIVSCITFVALEIVEYPTTIYHLYILIFLLILTFASSIIIEIDNRKKKLEEYRKSRKSFTKSVPSKEDQLKKEKDIAFYKAMQCKEFNQ